ncbi:hypothetical protein [Pimelobacter simplex]|uniref:hypothetical protein n=1 Tax=Nocardioides simplex TaxID=2045 RepID=UPI003AAAF458
MTVPRHRRNRAPSRSRRRLAAGVAATLTATLPFATTALPAQAAGNGVLDIVITPVDLSDGSTIADIEDGTHDNKVTYKVQYSCAAADCDATQVAFSPAPADPNGLLPAGEWILEYSSWVAPAAGGSIAGTDVTGKVVDLGNLAAGTSGTFSVTYGYQASRNREVPNGSFYPNGFDVPMSATISSGTATAPKTSSSQVTWHVGTPTGPSAGLGTSNPTFDTDVEESYRIAVNPGNMRTNPGSNVAGDAGLVAAGSYKIVYTVPAEAVIQDAGDGGVIDNVNHTVTWTKGSAANPSYGARGGWGLAALSGFNSGGAASNNGLVGPADAATWGPRTVKVTFPAGNFPEADASGCNFVKDVTSNLAVTVTYLDPARTQKSLDRDLTTKVACTNPFGGVSTAKTVSNGVTTNEGDGDLGGGVLAVNTPAPGEEDTGNREWRVSAGNIGNVDATAVIDEPNLDQDHIKVHRIIAYQFSGAPAGWEASVAWTDNTGATGTAQLGHAAFVDAAPGRWFVSARTTAALPAGRILPSDNTATVMQVGYRFKVDDGAIPLTGEERTNTADVSMSYPADADGDGTADDYTTLQGQPLPSRQVDQSRSRTVRYTKPLPTLTPGFVGTPVVTGGGTPRPGTEVTFSMRALTSNVWPGTSVRPQLVFVAPLGWEVVPGSASFTANGTGATTTAPAGVTYAYRTATIGGEQRSVAVATYPSAVALSAATNDYWPTLAVKAKPTNAAVPGVVPSGSVWAGDQSGTWRDATGNGFESGPNQFRVAALAADSGDVDADGDTTEEYASQTTAFGNLVVDASDGLSVVKQLCVPDAGAADGCDWVGASGAEHLVPADAGTVKYRVRLVNAGNTTLHDVIAYDVLPHPGDTGLLAGAGPRGSELALALDGVAPAPGVTVTASGSTNPARPEVNPGATGTTDDWGPVAAGRKAVRMDLDGDLAAGDEKVVVLTATVAPGARAGQVACNSVAVDSRETLPAEPPSVCVTLDQPLNPPPVVAVTGPADGAELAFGADVPAAYTCTDDDLVSCVGTDEHGDPVPNGSGVDTTTPGTHTLTVTGTDAAGQSTTKQVTYTVKPKPNEPPTVTIAKPVDGATYFVGQDVPAAYTCADADGTVVACVGPVAPGAKVDTSTPGSRQFKVTATDDDGATASRSVGYTVVAVRDLCRGTPISLLGLRPGTANDKTTPCATDKDKELNLTVTITPAIPLLGVPASQVQTGVLTGTTQSGPGSAAAQAEVASVRISILGQTINATGLTSSASSALTGCGAPALLSGHSSIASLTLNNKPVANLDQSLTLPLVIGSLGLNERSVTGNTVTRSALHLNVAGLVDLALGQSVAGATC